ncbi:MAG: alpha-galactosidase [Victivallales bacterium]|nr:alpha-galactosidase [Victivallales bacterium]
MEQIIIDNTNLRFLINTTGSSYAFQVNNAGFLTHLHWGGRIDRMEDLPNTREIMCHRHYSPRRGEVACQEYPGWGGEFYGEPALKADFPGGVRCSLLKYKKHFMEIKEEVEELVVVLEDGGYPLEVHLHYRVYADTEIIERWAEIINHGTDAIKLNSAMSACFNLPLVDHDYRLSHLAGRWGKEHTIERQSVNQSKIILESRTGLSGPFAAPFFALDEGFATEHSGRVWFGALHWSGNWKMAVERDGYDRVSVCGGINDFDFSWPLNPQETFTTPVFCAGISSEGFGGASRMLHTYQRKHILPPEIIKKPMPLIFNSWSSMGIKVNEAKILDVAKKAAKVGAEMFVIDDGWQAALGDWWPDTAKFPCGLKPVIEQVKALGMDFGLWVEIESFEINSQLYREHPDWGMSFPGRDIYRNVRDDVNRTSMMLNLAREDVREYLYTSMRELIVNTGIKYLKLDMNCYFTNPGWDAAPPEERQTIWVRYVQNLYSIFDRLNREFPDVLLENCAAGAGRSDLAMSRCFGRMNRSDNQDTLDILRMHEGYTWLHLSRMAGGACHISDAVYHINLRKIPMKFQAYTGMMGSLAIGKNLPSCTAEELEEIRSYAELYKKLRHIPQFGEMYRVASHYDHPYAAFEFVSADKQEALLFVLGHSIQFADKVPALRMRGLDPDAVYTIECHGNNPQGGYTASINEYQPMSGRGLMELGVRVELLGDYDARILHFKRGAK